MVIKRNNYKAWALEHDWRIRNDISELNVDN
jgi:hypothetical protein